MNDELRPLPASVPAAQSRAQGIGEEISDRYGFLGVPRQSFEVGGRAQLARLLEHGLQPESRVLDIGCGCLRVAYWLVRFLDRDGYCGIEPAKERVELGKQYLLSPELIASKRPRFDHNAVFDTSVFGGRFDFFLAGSIWTHCSKQHLETTLDGFLSNTSEHGVFLASYLPAAGFDDDYRGSQWVGTSHESSEPGIVRHQLSFIQERCQARALQVTELPGLDCDSQYWLRIERS